MTRSHIISYQGGQQLEDGADWANFTFIHAALMEATELSSATLLPHTCVAASVTNRSGDIAGLEANGGADGNRLVVARFFVIQTSARSNRKTCCRYLFHVAKAPPWHWRWHCKCHWFALDFWQVARHILLYESPIDSQTVRQPCLASEFEI